MSLSSAPSDAKGPKIVAECEASGEPYFVIRAKDQFSLDTLSYYGELFDQLGPDNVEYTEDIRRLFYQFTEWRRANAERVRYPD